MEKRRGERILSKVPLFPAPVNAKTRFSPAPPKERFPPAQKLLRTTDLPVAQVADSQGEVYPMQRVSGQNSPLAFGYIQVPEYPTEEEDFQLFYVRSDRSYRLEVGA